MFFFNRLYVLFTDKYNDFIEANRIEDADNRLKTMNKLVRVGGQERNTRLEINQTLTP